MSQTLKTRTRIEPGTIIAGKYEVEAQVGRGGMGLILAARHLHLDERVALKFLLAPDERIAEFQERFLREARITAKLRGAHVARTLDYGVTDEGDPYIVMEYLEGVNLRELLRESGPLPLEVAVNYTLQACEGLAEAHRNEVVHRDLKPANLFLTKHLDGGDLLKILDFGVSKLRNFAAAQSDLTEAGAILGSPKYMAIEQLQQAGDVDERADVWSLGAILYEMLSGRPPFDGPNTTAVCMAIMGVGGPAPLSQLRPELPSELDAVIAHCLSRDLFARTPNVAKLAEELVEASGISGLAPAVQAIADVLSQAQLSSTSTGQMRAFGQTGSHSSSNSKSSEEGRGGGSGAGAKDTTPIDALDEAVPRADNNGRPRTLLLSAIGLIVLGGLAAYFFTRPSESSHAAAESGTPAPAASVNADAAIAASVNTPDSADGGRDAETDTGTSHAQDAALDAPNAKPRARVWGPPPPPPPAKTSPTSTATKKKPQDAFGSRY